MRRTLAKGLPLGIVLLMWAAFSGPLLETQLSAQPGSKKKGKAAMEEKDGARVQLPPYFKDVVDEKQKEQIYAIQKKYADKTADLKQQLLDLNGQKNKEIDAVLTADQRKKIDALRSGAKEKSKVKKESKSSKSKAADKTDAKTDAKSDSSSDTKSKTKKKP